jgi:hypothetical protein
MIPHSCLSATIGSTRMARRAGTEQATAPMTTMIATAPMSHRIVGRDVPQLADEQLVRRGARREADTNAGAEQLQTGS